MQATFQQAKIPDKSNFSSATLCVLYPLIVACLSVAAYQKSATASTIESCSSGLSRPAASVACQKRGNQLNAVMAGTGLSRATASVSFQRGYQLNGVTAISGLSRPAASIR
jgi:hypothetical protein